MQRNTETESLAARDGNQVTVGNPGFLTETAVAEGIYHADCVGPREKERAAYIRFRDQIAEIETRGLLFRLANRSKLRDLNQRMIGIELVPQWQDVAPNIVTTVGKNLALDSFLAGSSYTVVGPFMGLISSVSYTAVALGDTMASHSGWLEAGATNAPSYTAPRKTAAWSAASSGAKALSASLTFSATATAGTIKGCFLVFGSGAVSTIDSTAGTLYSAGLFTGGDQPVVNGNTLNISYTASL